MSLTPWLEITIVGFVYTLSLFVLFLSLIRKFNLEFEICFREYLPYLVIVVVFGSYVVGQAAHVIMQIMIEKVCTSYEYNAVKQIKTMYPNMPEHFRQSYATAYSNLVMFRHLTFGTFLLGVLLYRWIGEGQFKELRKGVVSLMALLLILFFLSWRANAYYFAQTRDAMPKVFRSE